MPTTLLCPKQHPLRVLVPLWRLLLEILPTDWAGGHLASAVSTYSIVTTLKRKMHCSPLFNTHGMHVTFTRLTAEQGLRLFKADRTVYIVFWGKRNRFLQKYPKLVKNIVVFFRKMHTHICIWNLFSLCSMCLDCVFQFWYFVHELGYLILEKAWLSSQIL